MKDNSKNGHTYMQWLFAIIANLTFFDYGLQAGWLSPMGKVLQSENSPSGEPISDTMMSWIASCMGMAALIATPIFSYLIDAYGRKKCVIAIAVIQGLCWTIKLISASPVALLIARITFGLGGGGGFCVIPAYIKEISQESNRGALASLLMLSQSVGFVTIYGMGALHLSYTKVLWIVITVPIMNVLLMLVAPESPAYLVKIGKIKEAKAAIALLRGRDIDEKYVTNEISAMMAQDEYFKSLPKMSYRTILSDKAYRKGIIVMIFVITSLTCGGNFAIFTYASNIVMASGMTFNPDLQTLLFPIVMMLGGGLSIAFINRMKRKVLLLVCVVSCGLCHAVLASTILLQSIGIYAPGWLAIGAITVSVFMSGAGVLPVPYVIMSEIFNFQVRAKLIGTVVTYGWSITFIQLSCFGPVSKALGMHTMFYAFSAVNFFCAIILGIILPETKGKTIEEIEVQLRGKR